MAEELNDSELGTQKYWDNRYKIEINNFRGHGDVGEVWFGEESMDRVCRWIFKTSFITKTSKIIDLGCGNGLFLMQLAKNGFQNLVGVDYSEDAITLAKEISEKEEILNISYKMLDILGSQENKDKYSVVHDKGTYDAISLSADSKTSRQIYIENVYNMLENDGLFIITSCNWTKEELESHFTPKFTFFDCIPTPQFKFGGQTGSTVISLVFKK